MRIIVDFNLCESNALCVAMAPDLFQLDDNDHLHVRNEHVSEDLRAEVEATARVCPKLAIRIE